LHDGKREKGVTVERDKNNTANTGAGSIDIDEEVSVLQDGGIEQMTFEDICALAEENMRLKQELRIRDNDILSHDQVFDSIVRGH
jgi:hypothetical protein